MTFTVTYRGADGALREDRVEAASRTECIAQCRAHRIAPLSVKEGGGRDRARPARAGCHARPSTLNSQPSTRNWRSAVPYVLSVAFVALAIGGGAWWWMRRDRVIAPYQPEVPKKPSLAKEVKPAAAPKPEPVKATSAPVKKKWRSLHGVPESETNTLTAAEQELWKRFHPSGPIITNSLKASSFEETVFGPGTVNSHIAFLLTAEPGTAFLGRSEDLFNERFRRRFVESLSEEIAYAEDDPANVRELKDAVKDVRAELKRRMEAGEDICKLLAEARNELQQLGAYRSELDAELKRICADGEMTDKDVDDYIAAANTMLRERGLKELSGKSLMRRRVRLKTKAERRKDK